MIYTVDHGGLKYIFKCIKLINKTHALLLIRKVIRPLASIQNNKSFTFYDNLSIFIYLFNKFFILIPYWNTNHYANYN